jgi:NTP pyrophosphatase (non-canonical NTP hydrolase)
MPQIQTDALESVLIERARQNLKWGQQDRDPITWSVILSEECGEFAQSALHDRFGGHAAAGLREEAVQVAAVALQIVECIDRQRAARPVAA